MEDLTDVALTALENYESSDTQDSASDISSAEGENADTEKEAVEQENAQSDAAENTQETDGESDGEQPEQSEEKHKEISDEDFERMAKERGFTKPNDTERKLQETQEQLRQVQARNSLPKPRELDEETWGGMSVAQKVIYNNLDYITVHGKNGDIKIKTPEQLPNDFEFASDKARAQFTNDIQAQETKAERLHAAIQTRINNSRQRAAQQAQAQRTVSEISELQKSGLLPTPKASPSDKDFNSDPATQQIDKVLNYMAQRRREGLNLSVKDALTLYKAEHLNEFSQDTPKAKGDGERKELAKKVSGNNKTTNKTAGDAYEVKYWRPGMSTEDVLDRALRDLD